MVDTIIFDADGTLYTPHSDEAYTALFEELAEESKHDTAAIREAWNEVVADIKDSKSPDERRRRNVLELFLAKITVPPSPERIEHIYHTFWGRIKDEMEYDDGLVPMLERLKADGKTLVIATDEFPDALYWKLSAFMDDPSTLFDAIVTPADTDEMKPSSRFFEIALERAGGETNDTVMVGDSCRRDIVPAADHGLKTVLLGDDDGCEPDARIDTITDLEEVLGDL